MLIKLKKDNKKSLIEENSVNEKEISSQTSPLEKEVTEKNHLNRNIKYNPSDLSLGKNKLFEIILISLILISLLAHTYSKILPYEKSYIFKKHALNDFLINLEEKDSVKNLDEVIKKMSKRNQRQIKKLESFSVIKRQYKNISVNYAVFRCNKNNESGIKIRNINVIGGIPGKIVKFNVNGEYFCSYRK